MRRCIFLIIFVVLSMSLHASENVYELYFFRHAEKMKLPKKDPDLTELGQARANALSLFLEGKKLDRIYSTGYLRTMNTAKPVATSLGLTIEEYDPRELQTFAKQLLADQKQALVVGHSNTTPELVTLVGGDALLLAEDDYGDLTVLSIDKTTGKIQTQHLKIEP